MNHALNFVLVSLRRLPYRAGCLVAGALFALTAAAADAPRMIEKNATGLFAQNHSEQALAYLEAQITAPTPAEKDLAVAQQLTQIAFIFYGRKDRPHAESVASLACGRAEPRLVDGVLSTAHFAICRDQALACELILGDFNRAVSRIDIGLHYIEQAGGSDLAQAAAELRLRRARLIQKIKVLQRPS